MAPMNITGQKFNRLTVLRFDSIRNSRSFWWCKCDCGVEKSVQGKKLMNGQLKSCGCQKRERTIAFNAEKRVQIEGQRFGRLTVIAFQRINESGQTAWLCRCDCGTEKVLEAGDLRRKNGTRSCGCWRRDCARQTDNKHRTHGEATKSDKTVEYVTWIGMRARCSDTNPNSIGFKYYHSRGIKVCRGWGQFEAFLADMGRRPEGMTIDRKDNDGNYSCGRCPECLANGWPMNCRWATRQEQIWNSRICLKPASESVT